MRSFPINREHHHIVDDLCHKSREEPMRHIDHGEEQSANKLRENQEQFIAQGQLAIFFTERPPVNDRQALSSMGVIE
jgi:hypothetical protein